MRPPSAARPDRALDILWLLTIVVAVTLAALILHVGDPGSIDWWWTTIPFGLWIVGPAVLPWVIARFRRRPGVPVAMLIFLVASSLMSGIAYHDAFFPPTSSTSALVLVFVPLLQWIGLVIVATITLVATSRAFERPS